MDDNQGAATKRKPTRPAKVSTGAKSKKRKTESEIIGSIQATSLAKEKTNYINMFEFKPESYREFNPDNSTEKTEIIEAMDKETIVPLSEEQSIAVNDLLRELDCFELKSKNETENKATQSSVCPMVTNNQATQIEPEPQSWSTCSVLFTMCVSKNLSPRMDGVMVLNAPGANVCCLPLWKSCTDNYTRNCRNKTGNSWRVSVISQ